MATPGKEQSGFAAIPVAGKAGILVALVVAVVLVYYFALHQPLADEIASAETMHTQLLGQAAAAEQRAHEYLELRAQLDARAPLDRQNKRILPERAEIPAFLQDLNRLSDLSGLNMQLVEPQQEESQPQYVRIPVALQVHGRYHAVAKFFYNVSRLDRAIGMEDVHLTHPHFDGEDVVLDVSVMATTYRRPTDAETAAAQAATVGPNGQPVAPPAGGAR